MRALMKLYTDRAAEKCDEVMTLKQMQEFVGGYIELAPSVLVGKLLVMNEEGLLKKLPLNATASMLIHPATLTAGGVYGNVLVAIEEPSDFDDEEVSGEEE